MKAALALTVLLLASSAQAQDTKQQVIKDYRTRIESRSESLKKELRMKLTPQARNRKLAEAKFIKDALAGLEKGKILAPDFDTMANDKDASKAYEPKVGQVFTATDENVRVVRGKLVDLVYYNRYLGTDGSGRAATKVESEVITVMCKGPFERGKVYFIAEVDDVGSVTIERLD